jgi:hypothetical protein
MLIATVPYVGKRLHLDPDPNMQIISDPDPQPCGGRDVAGKIITYDELFAMPLLQPGQEELHKPLLKQKHIEPAAIAALVDGALQAALLPGSVHIQCL